MKKLKIGLTGGIGSGKSTVASVFKVLDIPVFNSDEAAKYLMDTDSDIKNIFIKHFGKNIYTKDGKLNRKLLANIIFSNKEELEFVNSVVHPAVKDFYEKWHSSYNTAYTIKEAAILIESRAYIDMDKIIVVSAPQDIRIKRVMKRDNLNYENVISRIKNQLNEDIRLKYADFIIVNDEKTPLINQIVEIDEILSKMSKN